MALCGSVAVPATQRAVLALGARVAAGGKVRARLPGQRPGSSAGGVPEAGQAYEWSGSCGLAHHGSTGTGKMWQCAGTGSSAVRWAVPGGCPLFPVPAGSAGGPWLPGMACGRVPRGGGRGRSAERADR
jgi:hypothetical protein